MQEPDLIILAPIMFLAFLSLVSPKPSLSALLLLIESGLITFFLSSHALSGTSILLSLFALPILAANIYIEKCLPRYSTTPKLNLFMGTILFCIFIFFIERFKNLKFELLKTPINQLETTYDLLTITGVIFIFFSVILSAFSVINLKNT